MRISVWSSYVCSSDLIASAYRANVTQIPCQSLVPSAAVKKCSIRKPEARLPNTAPTPLVITMNDPCALARMRESLCCSTNSEPEMLKKRSEEHTSELQSLMRISYAVFCLKNKNKRTNRTIMTTKQIN